MIPMAPATGVKAESTVVLAGGAMVSDHLGGIRARKPFRQELSQPSAVLPAQHATLKSLQ